MELSQQNSMNHSCQTLDIYESSCEFTKVTNPSVKKYKKPLYSAFENTVEYKKKKKRQENILIDFYL